jgi:hypothetical protein
VTDAGLGHLKGLKALHDLNLYSTHYITDAGLKHLTGLTNLQRLNLGQTQVTDAGLEHLRGLKKLQSLNLEFAKVTDAGLEHIQGLTDLHRLLLVGTKVNAGLKLLNRFTKLESLNLQSTELTDAGLAHIEGLVTLQDLDLSSTRVTDAGLEHLEGLSQLRELNLACAFRVTDAGLKHLEGLANLQELNLGRNFFTDTGLKHLTRLTNLNTLRLNVTKVTDAGLEHLNGLTELKTLDLRDTKMTDKGLMNLEGLVKLQRLSLHGTNVTDAGLEHVKGLINLRELDLQRTRVSDAGLEHLKGLTALQYLFLPDGITAKGLKHLKGLATLKSLCVGGEQVLVFAEEENNERDYRKLVAGLASPNKPIKCDNSDEAVTVSIPPNYDWKAQARIERNRRILFDNCEEALPFLIEGCTDARYSLTSHWSEDDIYSWCVGEVCLEIVASHVEIFREHTRFRGPREWHEYNFIPRLHSAIGSGVTAERKKQVQDWWRGRRGKSLLELQVEAFDWAIEKRKQERTSRSAGKPDENAAREDASAPDDIRQLIAARDKLKKDHKCLPPRKMWPSFLHSPTYYREVPWTEEEPKSQK